MAKWKFNHFTDKTELTSATTNAVVANVVLGFIVALDGIAFGENLGVLIDSAIVARLTSNNFEFDCAHGAVDCEGVAFVDGTEGGGKVGLEELLKEIAGDAFNCVCIWKNCDFVGVGTVFATVD